DHVGPVLGRIEDGTGHAGPAQGGEGAHPEGNLGGVAGAAQQLGVQELDEAGVGPAGQHGVFRRGDHDDNGLLDGGAVLQEGDEVSPATGVRVPLQDLEIEAVYHNAQGFRGAGDAVDHRLAGDAAGVERVDPAAGVGGAGGVAKPVQEVEVEGLDEGRV